MIIVRGRPARLMLVEIDGATAAISEGAVVMPGVTDETNRSSAIIASGAAADAIGILAKAKPAAAASDHDPDAGTIFSAAQFDVAPFMPGCEVAAELANDADNDVDVASATSTVITITSLEDDIDGSWVYVRAGTGVGQLGYITASASGNFTLKNATGLTTLDSTSKVLILRRKFHLTCELNATTAPATKIASTAAAGSLPWRVLRNEFKRNGQEYWRQLDPTAHHGLTGLNNQNVIFRQLLSPADTLLNPLD